MPDTPGQLGGISRCDDFPPGVGTALSYNIGEFVLPSRSTAGRSTAVASAHLLGPAPGEAFTFLAFFLPLGAERGTSKGQETPS